MTEVILGLFLVLAAVFVGRAHSESLRSLSVQAEEAIALLLDAGCDVHYKHWHIFRTKTGKYSILNFDDNANALLESEETFDDINDAISKFVFRTKM